jgi:hypothetical protein
MAKKGEEIKKIRKEHYQAIDMDEKPDENIRELDQINELNRQIAFYESRTVHQLTFFQNHKIDKKSEQMFKFELKIAQDDICLIANRISSFYPYLFDFHIFLQEWGLYRGIDGKSKVPIYKYDKAYRDQRNLNNYVA